MSTRHLNKMQNLAYDPFYLPPFTVPFGVTYEKIGTIQRRGFLFCSIIMSYVIWQVFPIWVAFPFGQHL
jgi:hypothetical protein